ncbi:uncharacterized protein LOC141600935 [Silene latifolia]|uniref:uncharacterized protein LOC141600935 n=1 Tax=Silene latifolia TaxID=37657 RepID=UPI003D76E628
MARNKTRIIASEEAQNRPDLVSRVFRSKLFELKKDICVRKIFVYVAGYVYVVEFQKRGLPHAHFLIILDSKSKIRKPDQYDEFVSAELPDATDNPHLFSAVVRHMMHGPCGRQNPDNSCMVNVKYMYKYVYKGHDRISFAVTDPSGSGQESFDEITSYQSTRWISPPEAAWRIFELHLNEIHPNVVPLQCLAEAVQYQIPAALHRLFTTLLIYCQPNNPRLLWDKFYTSLSEDCAFDFPAQGHKVLQMTVTNISCILESMGKSFSNFNFGDLNFEAAYFNHSITKEIEEELNIPISSEDINAVNMLNEEQRLAYDKIYRRVTENGTGSFFLDGPGVASSGIAAANLPGGITSNSRFKIPLDIENNQSSQISKQSPLAELIRSCKLIVWDEAPMAKRQSIEYFEKTLRDVCSSTEMFGGKIVVFGGDFRQVLPIIPKSTLQEAVNSSFVMSPLWHELERLHLTVNIRAMGDPAFCDFVLSVGNGSHPYENGKDVKLPRSIVISGTEETTLIEELIDTIYPDIQRLNINPSLTTKRAILTPKNDDAQMINSILVYRQEGEPFTYRSFDEATDVATEQYPLEIFNTFQPSGLPPHELVLKINSPIILLRNLDPTSGLCNGTRLICKAFDRNVIDAEIVVGHHKGKRVFIPRIPLQPSPSDKFPFQFRRKQFPIRLSFAMTINKAQGQTLSRVGIYLPRPVFSHGQLYVALSRARQSSDITVAILPHCTLSGSWRRTRNIVGMTSPTIPLSSVTERSRNFTVVLKLESIKA